MYQGGAALVSAKCREVGDFLIILGRARRRSFFIDESVAVVGEFSGWSLGGHRRSPLCSGRPSKMSGEGYRRGYVDNFRGSGSFSRVGKWGQSGSVLVVLWG